MADFPFKYSRSVQAATNQSLHLVQQLKKHHLKNPNHTPSPALLTRIDEGYGIGDPLCDAWLDDAQHLPQKGMDLFQQALDHGIDAVDNAPDSLKALFAQADQAPAWLDEQQLRLAAQALERYPIIQSLMLQSVSLMGGYSVPGLSEPLIYTGALANSILPRMARTLAFAASVTIPHGVKHRHVGYCQTLRVRVVHGWVRAKLRQSNDWDTERFGIPINQTDLIATNMTFSLVVLHGLMSFGCVISDDETNSILHLWRYIGYLLGIQQDLMPITLDECNEWFYAYMATQKMDAANAKPLAESLHELPQELETRIKLAATIEQALRSAITRYYWGDDISDELGLPKHRWAMSAIHIMQAGQFTIERLERMFPPLSPISMRVAEMYRNRVKNQYIHAHDALKPLFDEIENANTVYRTQFN